MGLQPFSMALPQLDGEALFLKVKASLPEAWKGGVPAGVEVQVLLLAAQWGVVFVFFLSLFDFL